MPVMPGQGFRAVAGPDNGTVQELQSKFDHDVLHFSHKALGTRSGRGGRGEGHAPACDRSGGKCALCALTRGSWCEEFYRQERVAWKLPPRGSKECPATKWGPCNGVGNCHYDIGVCQCPAGWRGAACDEPNKRPCTNAHKTETDPLDHVESFVAPDGSDLDLTASGWTASRCAGHCDADRATCWCPASTAFGRKPPPPDSPPWVRYSQRGRPIGEGCKPGKVPNAAGELVENDWGHKQMSYVDVMGPNSWCNAKKPAEIPQGVTHQCGGWRGCSVEGLHGPLCDEVSEETCLNQCSGHGECDEGYCRCHPGWYGQDCARKKAGEALEPGLQEVRPWLKDVALTVPAAATEPPAAAAAGAGAGAGGGGADAGGRLRPLIYLYDMPPEFTSRMHQYKFVKYAATWGRMDPDHTSNTAYVPDNYTQSVEWPGVLGGADSTTLYKGHPCYDPAKDLVIPGFKVPEHFKRSPLLGGAPFERDMLLYLRGDVGKHRLPNYSRGIRQKLFSLSTENQWGEKHRIFIGEQYGMPGDYSEHLSRSTFCAVVPGDGYAMRFEDAVLHGCLPLIIMDNTHAVFESIVDIDSFSLRITEAAVNEHLPYVLKAISADQIERMQRRLALVWHRYVYAHGPLLATAMRELSQRNLGNRADDDKDIQPVHSFPHHTDAVATIIQWLHSRIRDTRGAAA
ncbi:hypothetical protein TSOC_004706 [Tetrabaena socialis]|uniref:EGF-like domain-containing protein n=1 Tax=Tetrabaena socialis TaxID=47790 RepID=A0A2J8A880_9CHLO|nr:hypothetical protein TSOC_004706 [Tetrabaena socialis]|eukprot:PNH08721.1 hypothetical protein TSOC_004706 [Tetrabaena socialis]